MGLREMGAVIGFTILGFAFLVFVFVFFLGRTLGFFIAFAHQHFAREMQIRL